MTDAVVIVRIQEGWGGDIVTVRKFFVNENAANEELSRLNALAVGRPYHYRALPGPVREDLPTVPPDGWVHLHAVLDVDMSAVTALDWSSPSLVRVVAITHTWEAADEALQVAALPHGLVDSGKYYGR